MFRQYEKADDEEQDQLITSDKRKCLLWEDVQQPEADSKIEEEHLLKFVVNSLDEELAIDLGENVKVSIEKLYEVLAGASVLCYAADLRVVGEDAEIWWPEVAYGIPPLSRLIALKEVGAPHALEVDAARGGRQDGRRGGP